MVTTFTRWLTGRPTELSVMISPVASNIGIPSLSNTSVAMTLVQELRSGLLDTEGVQAHKQANQSDGLKTMHSKCVEKQRGNWRLFSIWYQ